MVALEQLRYVRLVADDLGQAADFAQRMLGLEPIDRTENLATFRSDFRDYTLAFATGDHAVQSVGLEVRYSADLDAAMEGLRRLGLSAGRGSAEECALRKVKDMVWFADFSGNRIELVVRPLNSGWRYFPSRDAGVRGLADVIMRSVDIEKDLSIWSGVLGAQVSDWAGDAAYLRFDDAHHRIVLFPARAARHSRRRIRGRGRQSADAELLRSAGFAGRRSARAGTPSGLRAAVSDVRRARRRSVQLRRGRRGGRSGQAPAAAVSRRPRRALRLGKRMQGRRVQRPATAKLQSRDDRNRRSPT